MGRYRYTIKRHTQTYPKNGYIPPKQKRGGGCLMTIMLIIIIFNWLV
jgi:hypothetical protein